MKPSPAPGRRRLLKWRRSRTARSIWSQVCRYRSGSACRESTRVCRLQTDSCKRIIGRKVSPAGVASAVEIDASNLLPDAAFAALQQPANTATCSTSSARLCGLADFHDVADEARRFLNLPRPEPDLEPEPKHQPASAPAGSPESARRLFAMSQPITRHNRRSVFAQTRYYCFARNRSLTFPSALLLSARSILADRDLAGDDRSRHRSRRPDHRRPSHLARPGSGQRQGADRHAAPRDGPSPRQRRPLRHGARCDGRRRRHRDHAVASLRHADHADGGSTLGRAPRRHPVPTDATSAVCRPRQRSRRGWRDGRTVRPRTNGLDRCDRVVAAWRRLQR